MAHHTPTPWKLDSRPSACEVHVYSADFMVGELGSFTPTDRVFIIKAVNSHEALLQRLKDARWYVQRTWDETKGTEKEATALGAAHELRMIDRAIAQAEADE